MTSRDVDVVRVDRRGMRASQRVFDATGGLHMLPRQWASLRPHGIGLQKPHHYLEIARAVWQNHDKLPFAWRILRDGVCDGCALGTSGLADWTIPGVHLCMVRLDLMRLNTAPAIDLDRLRVVPALALLTSGELRTLGRLSEPCVRRNGEAGFRVVGWDEALDLVAGRLRAANPARVAFYLTSRGITNEVYYVAQKAARALGTNHVDNSARLCHAASTAAMKATIGHDASTCSYADWLKADLRARFSVVAPHGRERAPGTLLVSTRRGRQFNSMVHRERDPLTGAVRDDILMSEDDARARGLSDGARVRLVSRHGAYDGRVRLAPIKPGNLEVHWPEANALLPPDRLDPSSHEPDDNAEVRIEKV